MQHYKINSNLDRDTESGKHITECKLSALYDHIQTYMYIDE